MATKPTLTDGVNTITLEHPQVGNLVKKNIWDKIQKETLNGTTLEQTAFRKYEYILTFKNVDATLYTTVYDFLTTALDYNRAINFSYTDKWSVANNVEVAAILGDEESAGGSMANFKLTLRETTKR
ncbi:MAG: hypothetical protein COZ07_06995 [Candidatus Infernicultor aquiphilus]|uniref:Uncharacterized protein n=1 Tax=Candidatus Infernicultor aquiphilus TaxID=1805029 RepID=A0A2M7PNA0_9BACT|nr:MAG: hypothetical protein COZ85_01220 [Candidatus Moranbacteria bacterium CG_4_8_14_3_um_filter_34_16]PIY32079.1 MAG: hypothetical protein COZ07_06995 [Candidatus Atribacteria bacterium CG_4_10_14_3_um_filter_34_13]